MSGRILSLAALTVLDLAPPAMIAAAGRCGYSHVGLRPIAATPTELHYPLLTDAALRRDVQRALDDHGVGVLDVEILRLRPDTRVADYEAALAFGAAFGARFALVAGNDPNHRRMADNLAALCDLARPFGIVPHLEFMPWTDVPNMATALTVANGCGRADVGLLVDAFHLNRSGGQVADVPAADPRFGYVQLCDIAGPIPRDMAEILREGRGDRLLPGEGDCPLDALLQRLPAGIPISVEAPGRRAGETAEARATAALAATRRLLGDIT